MLGFLNLNKPPQWTSHDCVAKVRRLLKIKKVGHGGTLDPAATGVLPIAVGKATRLLQFLPESKAYRAKIRLGVQTSTDDLEGEFIQVQPAPDLTLEQIKPLLSQLEGKIEQIPPAYSAIQQGGKRLYELARKGENVEVPSRTVQVDKIEILDWHPGDFPELELAIRCGPGTYIRAIARDLGSILKIGGTLAALKRTESCGMKLSESITLAEIQTQLEKGTFSLIPTDELLAHLPTISLEDNQTKGWCQGQPISDWQIEKVEELVNLISPVRVYHQSGQFLGIGEILNSDGYLLLIPKVVLLPGYLS